jgi:hypothetical protein
MWELSPAEADAFAKRYRAAGDERLSHPKLDAALEAHALSCVATDFMRAALLREPG